MASDTEPISDLEAFGQAILVEMDRFAAAGYSFEKWHPQPSSMQSFGVSGFLDLGLRKKRFKRENASVQVSDKRDNPIFCNLYVSHAADSIAESGLDLEGKPRYDREP